MKKQEVPKKNVLDSDDSDEPITKPKPAAQVQQKPQAKPNKALFGSDDDESSDDIMASKKVKPKSALKNQNTKTAAAEPAKPPPKKANTVKFMDNDDDEDEDDSTQKSRVSQAKLTPPLAQKPVASTPPPV